MRHIVSTTHNDVVTLEDEMWRALEMDDIHDEMRAGVAPGVSQVGMGTGHTHNACYGCSNSARTHGCGTCG